MSTIPSFRVSASHGCLAPRPLFAAALVSYAYNWSADNYGQNLGRVFGASGSANDTTGGVTPITKLDGPGTNFVTGTRCRISRITRRLTHSTVKTSSLRTTHTPVPKIYQWNLALQREIANNLVVELGYVASHGYDLVFGGNGGAALNQNPQSKILPD